MGVSGNFAGLARMRSMVSPQRVQAQVLPRIAQRVAVTTVELVGQEFDQGRDPYGAPWLPLKYRKGKPLQDTTRMQRSRTAQADGSNVRITVTASYAKYHQDGTKPHARAGAAIPQNRRGRFVSKKRAAQAKARVQKVAVFGGYQHGGIPRRQILPEASTGGLPSTWRAAISKDATDVLRKAFGG